ncbi:hypothetical protein MESMUL_16940 [Mesosutterella multiformis]|uniref:Twin-arginine translocation signal domain-containing protein n=2 Tax=Mesosutterella multiformis TaxID=2259133 RepID=A0A388SFX1_9BURK|nr:hypothetical protein MESMUL_16940 [Mesosutterella multiformis]
MLYFHHRLDVRSQPLIIFWREIMGSMETSRRNLLKAGTAAAAAVAAAPLTAQAAVSAENTKFDARMTSWSWLRFRRHGLRL